MHQAWQWCWHHIRAELLPLLPYPTLCPFGTCRIQVQRYVILVIHSLLLTYIYVCQTSIIITLKRTFRAPFTGSPSRILKSSKHYLNELAADIQSYMSFLAGTCQLSHLSMQCICCIW